MKNVIRAFVVALTLTGVAASAHTVSAKTTVQVTNPMLASYPVPMCPPNDPNACGLGAPK
jgi:hypothetical protein